MRPRRVKLDDKYAGVVRHVRVVSRGGFSGWKLNLWSQTIHHRKSQSPPLCRLLLHPTRTFAEIYTSCFPSLSLDTAQIRWRVTRSSKVNNDSCQQWHFLKLQHYIFVARGVRKRVRVLRTLKLIPLIAALHISLGQNEISKINFFNAKVNLPRNLTSGTTRKVNSSNKRCELISRNYIYAIFLFASLMPLATR